MDNQFLHVEPKKDTSVVHKGRIERVAVSRAIYMVTDLFREDEPLRLALRNTAVDMLKDKMIDSIYKLKTLITLSANINLISESNANILFKAIESIIEEDKVLNIQPDVKIEISTMISVDAVSDIKPKISIVEDVSDITDTVEVLDKVIDKDSHASPTLIIKNTNPTSSVVTTLDIGARRKKILEVVKSKGQATIHEFIQSIQGCSSKTIQRELTSLVLSGTLKKTGERRWSKYSLR